MTDIDALIEKLGRDLSHIQRMSNGVFWDGPSEVKTGVLKEIYETSTVALRAIKAKETGE